MNKLGMLNSFFSKFELRFTSLERTECDLFQLFIEISLWFKDCMTRRTQLVLWQVQSECTKQDAASDRAMKTMSTDLVSVKLPLITAHTNTHTCTRHTSYIHTYTQRHTYIQTERDTHIKAPLWSTDLMIINGHIDDQLTIHHDSAGFESLVYMSHVAKNWNRACTAQPLTKYVHIASRKTSSSVINSTSVSASCK